MRCFVLLCLVCVPLVLGSADASVLSYDPAYSHGFMAQATEGLKQVRNVLKQIQSLSAQVVKGMNTGSRHVLQFPDMPDVPNMLDVPNMPNMPNIPNIPSCMASIISAAASLDSTPSNAQT